MSNKLYMYVSSWKEHGGQPGIGFYTLDEENGHIEFVKMINEEDSVNCSYVDRTDGIIYFCNEVVHIPNVNCNSGSIIGCRILKQNGELLPVFRQPTYCPNPSFLSLDKTGRYMLVAHHSVASGVARMVKNASGIYEPDIIYSEADLQLYRLNEQKMPEFLVDNIKHILNQETGEGSHPHCTVVSPSGKLIAVCDKGDGYLYLYTIDYKEEKLRLLSRTLTDVEGAAPRYCVFHPSKPWLFVNYEKMINDSMKVTAFVYQENGEVEKLCSADALEDGYEIPENILHEQQGFCIHPNGKYLYTLLNGPNEVAVFSINQDTGYIKRIQNIKVEGKRPRGLAVTPDGKYIVTGCLVGGELASYKVLEDGRLVLADSGQKQKGASYMSFWETNKGSLHE